MCILCAAAAASAAAAAPASAAATASRFSGRAGFIVAEFVRPVLFSVFGIKLYSYGFFVALALGTAFMIFGNDLRKINMVEIDEYVCFFVFLFGFAVGSKGHLALSAFGAGEPLTWKSLDITTGHSFMGSIIGAVGCMLVYITFKRVSILRFLDVLLPCCLFGHFVGKIGCFASGDGCYGPVADPERVPWAMSFPNGMVPTHEPVHPTPIYESLLSLGVFLVARLVHPLPSGSSARKAGRRSALVLMLYGVERVVVEQFRRHPPIKFFGGLTEYQALAIALLIIGVFLYGYTGNRLSDSASAGGARGGKRKTQ